MLVAVTWSEGALAVAAVIGAIASAISIFVNRRLAANDLAEARRQAAEQAADARHLATIEAKRVAYAEILRGLLDMAIVFDEMSGKTEPLGDYDRLGKINSIRENTTRMRASMLVLSGDDVRARYEEFGAALAELTRDDGPVGSPTDSRTLVSYVDALGSAMKAELDAR